jgi:polyvinyl alcohol dehydrogenase (cytochrome)
VVVDGTVIVGTASNEELVAALVPPDFWQWTFRGSAVALDVATGAIKWRTYTVPPGYFGGAIWGSTPAVDRQRNQVYVATGNNYSVPPAVVACLKSGQSEAACMAGAPTNYFNSIIALDLTTGAIKWGSRAMPYDAWNVACGLSIPFVFTIPGNFFGAPTPGAYGNCPDPIAPSPDRKTGPDWDFAQGPMIFSGPGALGARGLVGAGQKSGKFWAFRATDGALVWSTQVAPGGVTGGLQWGSATDGQRLFVAAANSGPALSGGGSGAEPWTLDHGRSEREPRRGSRQRRKWRDLRVQPRLRARHDVCARRQDRHTAVVVRQRWRLQRRTVDLGRYGLLGDRNVQRLRSEEGVRVRFELTSSRGDSTVAPASRVRNGT